MYFTGSSGSRRGSELLISWLTIRPGLCSMTSLSGRLSYVSTDVQNCELWKLTNAKKRFRTIILDNGESDGAQNNGCLSRRDVTLPEKTKCMYVYVCVYVCVCMYVYVYVCVYVCMYAFICVCMFVCIYVCTGVLINP